MTQVIDLEDLAISLGHQVHLCDLLVQESGLSPKTFILEAGCGSGKLSLNLVFRTKTMAILVDNDPEAISKSLRNLGAVEVLTDSRFPVIINSCDITKLPYPDRMFDLVFNEGVIEHFKDPTIPLREMARVSKKLVAAAVPNAENAKQRLMARRQVEAYAGRDHWAAYEKPMLVQELTEHMKSAGLKDLRAWHVWRDSTGLEDKPEQYRMVLGMGSV